MEGIAGVPLLSDSDAALFIQRGGKPLVTSPT
jgi:hypothetical protein